ncbi:MAG TPA: alpha-amylase [Pyrinomonadaceae bacterium]|nr:alpha-amylase [Pyrinomonadaceae bacterium]
MSENGVIIQYFEWYLPADGSLWRELAARSEELSRAGFTAVWIPPCSKASAGPCDVGYGQYDLFDLGEFNQKGSVRTKYGTKEELLAAIRAAQAAGMQVYADVVFNHKDGADDKEEVLAQQVEREDRNTPVGEWEKIIAWTKFTFEGRGDTHSSMKWYWWCFDSVSYNEATHDASHIYRLKPKGFETDVSHEHGNYDYLLANDLDMGEEMVRGELLYWGRWFVETTGVDGFRCDAVKHIRASWFPDWLSHLRSHFQRELFSVGEYWSEKVKYLREYIETTGGALSLFDVPLHYQFHRASRAGDGFDLRTIFDDTLVKENPRLAVTFVENHDTQPCQSLESTVEPWFKPLAYALILLRREGYPCVFYADYYGAEYSDQRCQEGRTIKLPSHRWMIDKFLEARHGYAYGEQLDYLDHPNTVGWTRLGDGAHDKAMAVLMSNGADGNKWMNVSRPDASFRDLTEHFEERVTTNADGWGNFLCKGGKVSVWIEE